MTQIDGTLHLSVELPQKATLEVLTSLWVSAVFAAVSPKLFTCQSTWLVPKTMQELDFSDTNCQIPSNTDPFKDTEDTTNSSPFSLPVSSNPISLPSPANAKNQTMSKPAMYFTVMLFTMTFCADYPSYSWGRRAFKWAAACRAMVA